MRRKLWIVFILLVVGLAGILATVYWRWVQRPLPLTQGALEVHGLRAPVEVLRDAWGLPHILAQNNHDLLMAQGYVQAQDRLWQMELNRRVAAGRLSEIIGPDTLGVDKLLRTFGLLRAARAELAQSRPEEMELLQAYADGVNAYIESRRERLPLEFRLLSVEPEPWVPEHSLAWGKLMALQGAKNWQEEIVGAMLVQRLGAEKAQELLGMQRPAAQVTVPPALALGEIFGTMAAADTGLLPAWVGGSNNWVVHGSHTDTGATLLSNDMHLDVPIPSIWYEMHLNGGDFDVIGLTLPGVPLVIAGHNREVAWGITFAYTDTQDLFLEKMNPDQPSHYLYKGQWRSADKIRESITVKGNPVPAIHDVLQTIHGPILTPLVPAVKGGEYALALRWSAYDSGGMIGPLAGMNQAANVAQFKAAALTWTDPPLNLVCADRHGDIAYILAGGIPIRPQGHGQGPFPGWDGQYDWTGYLPDEEKPWRLNPPEGFMATANNRLAVEEFARYLSADYLPPYRAQRIAQVLADKAKVSKEDCRTLQGDYQSLQAKEVLQALSRIKVHAPDAKDLLNRLRAWDCDLGPQSMGAAIYEVLFFRLMKNTFQDELGDTADYFFGQGLSMLNPLSSYAGHSRLMLTHLLSKPDSAWFDDIATPEKETLSTILEKSLSETDRFLRQTLGSDPAAWRWGRLHRIEFRHPLGQVKPLDKIFNLGPYEAGGDLSTVWQSTAAPGMDFNYKGWTVSNRHIYDLADWDNSLGMIVPGQSGMWGSPHYSDQMVLWLTVGHHPLYFSQARVENEAKQRLILSP